MNNSNFLFHLSTTQILYSSIKLLMVKLISYRKRFPLALVYIYFLLLKNCCSKGMEQNVVFDSIDLSKELSSDQLKCIWLTLPLHRIVFMDILDFDHLQDLTPDQLQCIFSKPPLENPLLNIQSESVYKTTCEQQIFEDNDWSPQRVFTSRTLEAMRIFEIDMCHSRMIYGMNIYFCIHEKDSTVSFNMRLTHQSRIGGCSSSTENEVYIGDWSSNKSVPYYTHKCSTSVFFKFIVWNLLRNIACKTRRVSISWNFGIGERHASALIKNVITSVWGHVSVSKQTLPILIGPCNFKILQNLHLCRKANANMLFRNFMLHTHERVGANSPAHDVLCVDVLELIYKYLVI